MCLEKVADKMCPASYFLGPFGNLPEWAWLSDADFNTDKAVFFVGDDVTTSLLREILLTRHCPESGQLTSRLARESDNTDN
jgi:hypothetical protein